jgi:hypothetical protein
MFVISIADPTVNEYIRLSEKLPDIYKESQEDGAVFTEDPCDNKTVSKMPGTFDEFQFEAVSQNPAVEATLIQDNTVVCANPTHRRRRSRHIA